MYVTFHTHHSLPAPSPPILNLLMPVCSDICWQWKMAYTLVEKEDEGLRPRENIQQIVDELPLISHYCNKPSVRIHTISDHLF